MTVPSNHRENAAERAAPADVGESGGFDHLPLREVIGSLPDYIFILDRELRVIFANRAIGARSPRQLEGLYLTQVFPPHLHPVVLASLHRVLATGEIDTLTTEIDGKDGKPRHFNLRVSPVRTAGTTTALTVHAVEVTEQLRAEHAIATQAEMIESMLEGVAVIDSSGVIAISNPAFDALFGYARGELIGQQMSSLAGWPFEQPDRWRLTSSDATSVTVEFDGQRRDGSSFAASGVLSRFGVAGRDHSLVVLQDVSERKQLERAILQAVNREQYRIGNDLHDGLGQELTGIALMLRGMAGRIANEYPQILSEVENITQLVNNAIESSRALARGLSPVNLERGGLQDALEGLAMHATEIYAVPTYFSQRLRAARPLNPEVANHLYRIAQEAVRNAVRHGKARTIRLHLSSARAKVTLAITDDGVGMPAEAMDASGMGLKIMQYRARILGGDVRIESVTPSGTRVVCDCPVEPVQARPVKPKRSARRRSATLPPALNG